jgi:hypothetical protein
MFDKDIEGYQKELEEIVALMEQSRVTFVEATLASLTQWYQTQARFHVQDQYELTLDVGPERLSQMKKKITQLITMAPAGVQRLLDDDKLWWHRSRGGGWRDPYMEGAPEPLVNAVKRLSLTLTPILIEYGYIRPNPDVTSVDSKRTPRSPTNGTPEFEWSEKMTITVSVYKDQLGRATFLDQKIVEARKLKLKYEAGALWDRV